MDLFCLQCEMEGEQDMIQRVYAAPRRQNWAVILLGGGHFAAAVFRGGLNYLAEHETENEVGR